MVSFDVEPHLRGTPAATRLWDFAKYVEPRLSDPLGLARVGTRLRCRTAYHGQHRPSPEGPPLHDLLAAKGWRHLGLDAPRPSGLFEE